VIDLGSIAQKSALRSIVSALAFFVDPATGAPRLVISSGAVFDAVAGGAAIAEPGELPKAVRERLKGEVRFADPTAGAPRLAKITDRKVNISDPVAGGEALIVLDVGSEVRSSKTLTVFEDPATGGLRLASGSEDKKVRVWDLAAGGAALLVLKVGSQVNALTAFADPATGETRLVSGSKDKTVRVCDASKGGAALRVVAFDDEVRALTVGRDMSGLFVAFGKRWGELRI
jgi:hypothetical protein